MEELVKLNKENVGEWMILNAKLMTLIAQKST